MWAHKVTKSKMKSWSVCLHLLSVYLLHLAEDVNCSPIVLDLSQWIPFDFQSPAEQITALP